MQPLFTATLTELKSKVRLSGIPEDKDPQALFEEAVQVVAAGFMRELGTARVAVLRALPYTYPPVTDNDTLRLTANTTEVKWCRAELLRTLSVLFPNSATPMGEWNSGSLFERNSFQASDEIERLMLDVYQALDLLKDGEGLGNTARNDVAIIGPTTTVPGPGDSARAKWLP